AHREVEAHVPWPRVSVPVDDRRIAVDVDSGPAAVEEELGVRVQAGVKSPDVDVEATGPILEDPGQNLVLPPDGVGGLFPLPRRQLAAGLVELATQSVALLEPVPHQGCPLGQTLGGSAQEGFQVALVI